MKRTSQLLMLAGVLTLLVGAYPLSAQDANRPERDRQPGDRPRGGPGGGFGDPAEFQQRMMERVKDQLEVKDDTEWKAIEPLVQKVMETRRDSMAFNVGGMMRGFRNRGGDGGGGGGGGGGRGPFGGEPAPEQEALQKAIDTKATNAEVKAAMAKFREARKAKEAALNKAQDELRKVLTVRQEAILVNNGMLN